MTENNPDEEKPDLKEVAQKWHSSADADGISQPGGWCAPMGNYTESDEVIRNYVKTQDKTIGMLINAIVHTVEYVGNDTLPAVEGWSWYDALMEEAPELAQRFKDNPIILHPTERSHHNNPPRGSAPADSEYFSASEGGIKGLVAEPEGVAAKVKRQRDAEFWNDWLRNALDEQFSDGTSVLKYILLTNPDLEKRLRKTLLGDEELPTTKAAPPEHLTPETTERGFQYLPEIESSYGGSIHVHESSAASDSYVWVRAESPVDINDYTVKKAHGQESECPMHKVALHLTTDDAEKLAEQLFWTVRNHYHNKIRE